ncbi:DUF364 domain-containing protein [Symbiobacterium thermophilum]|uniref:Heavy-metal chelation domain-containing protein n=1 Tax=Symbiobacterium thermophilum TaxID=2734 RepID=A0A953I9N1_SYMTR|nr:DUF364 domain-containing protein [Symbiobacterium thermophilum]MBY6276599.1 hypothetical protein [Symbiobacterium thermophilum]
MTLLERLYEAAAPRLCGKRVQDVRIGSHLVGVLLDSGEFGAAYALPGERQTPEPVFPDPARYVGMPAVELAAGLKQEDLVARALGMAAANAVARPEPGHCLEDPDALTTVPVRPADTVGLVGFIRSIHRRIEGRVNRIIVFDRSLDGEPGISPEEQQPELLPLCDVVFVTGSAVTNGTLEAVLPWCRRARDIVVIGPSTPLYPEAFAGTGVTVIAGATWPPEHHQAALAGIGAGKRFHDMHGLTRRWALRVG